MAGYDCNCLSKRRGHFQLARLFETVAGLEEASGGHCSGVVEAEEVYMNPKAQPLLATRHTIMDEAEESVLGERYTADSKHCN